LIFKLISYQLKIEKWADLKTHVIPLSHVVPIFGRHGFSDYRTNTATKRAAFLAVFY
jgi:hypothetical protein